MSPTSLVFRASQSTPKSSSVSVFENESNVYMCKIVIAHYSDVWTRYICVSGRLLVLCLLRDVLWRDRVKYAYCYSVVWFGPHTAVE